MFDLKSIRRAVEQIAEEKGIEPQKIMEAIESSIAAAYKKEYEKKGEFVKAAFNMKTGALQFTLVKTVVDESTVRIPKEGEDEAPPEPPSDASFGMSEELALPRYNPDRHIMLAEAQKVKPDAALGGEIEFPLETREDFGRIAAQTAKQVILQKLREAERESVLSEFKNRAGEIVSGLVQRFEQGNVVVELGRATGIMFWNETIPGEHYKPGDRLKFYVVAIQEETRIPGILLSRSHPKFVAKLFALEVPEVADGSVEIKSLAREPGSRTKVAVASKMPGVDPVGACVGQRGTRVMAVSNELGSEKVDVIEWSEDPAAYIGNALSPATVQSVEITGTREARAIIEERELSLAIGRGGQNVRLAARLTGWKIDVRSAAKPEEVQAEGVAASPDQIPEPPSSDDEASTID
jgi:N utilization substance protein A